MFTKKVPIVWHVMSLMTECLLFWLSVDLGQTFQLSLPTGPAICTADNTHYHTLEPNLDEKQN